MTRTPKEIWSDTTPGVDPLLYQVRFEPAPDRLEDLLQAVEILDDLSSGNVDEYIWVLAQESGWSEEETENFLERMTRRMDAYSQAKLRHALRYLHTRIEEYFRSEEP